MSTSYCIKYIYVTYNLNTYFKHILPVSLIYFRCSFFTSASVDVAAFHQFQISENRGTEIIYYLAGWADGMSAWWLAAAIYPSIYLPPWPLQVQFISQIINQPTVCATSPSSTSPTFTRPPIQGNVLGNCFLPAFWGYLSVGKFGKPRMWMTWPLPFDWGNKQTYETRHPTSDGSTNEKGVAVRLRCVLNHDRKIHLSADTLAKIVH